MQIHLTLFVHPNDDYLVNLRSRKCLQNVFGYVWITIEVKQWAIVINLEFRMLRYQKLSAV